MGALMFELAHDIINRLILKNVAHQIFMAGSVKADDMDTYYGHHNNSLPRIR